MKHSQKTFHEREKLTVPQIPESHKPFRGGLGNQRLTYSN